MKFAVVCEEKDRVSKKSRIYVVKRSVTLKDFKNLAYLKMRERFSPITIRYYACKLDDASDLSVEDIVKIVETQKLKGDMFVRI